MLPLLFFLHFLPAPSKGVASTSILCLNGRPSANSMNESLLEDGRLPFSERASLNLPSLNTLSMYAGRNKTLLCA